MLGEGAGKGQNWHQSLAKSMPKKNHHNCCGASGLRYLKLGLTHRRTQGQKLHISDMFYSALYFTFTYFNIYVKCHNFIILYINVLYAPYFIDSFQPPEGVCVFSSAF